MNTVAWLGHKVTNWLPRGRERDRTTNSRDSAAAKTSRRAEPLDPRLQRKILKSLRAIADPTVSEVEGGRRAGGVAQWYASASEAERRHAWVVMSESFAPDPELIRQAREAYEAAIGKVEEGTAEIRLRKALFSERTRLLQRFSVLPQGMRFLVDLRAEILRHVKSDKRLLALEAELDALFATWFDVAFLELRRISWDSPASLVEKLIKYEAVHDIKSWSDVKNRLDSDRRCYGFFHNRLPDEPLIFVEVAFTNEIASSISPLLDETSETLDPGKATTAIFYSISNTQSGLKGISFGDSLIKRVVETLKTEVPQLKTFATLSPIPGFRSWYKKKSPQILPSLPEKMRLAMEQITGVVPLSVDGLQGYVEKNPVIDADHPVARWLLHCASVYLGREVEGGLPVDPVARFHLRNGSRVENIHWMADTSNKAMQQSCGMMANYLYDLKRLDHNRRLLAKGKIATSRRLNDLHI